jgi:hypothetical protein
MDLQIAAAVELLQKRQVVMKPEPLSYPYPDLRALFLLFRPVSPPLVTDASFHRSETRAAPSATSVLTITQGNIKHSHMYLTPIMDTFPDDVLGGENRLHPAPKVVRIHWGDNTVETDIVRAKRMFRRRRWVRRFFEESRIAAGDRVSIEQLEPYVYRVSKVVQLLPGT